MNIHILWEFDQWDCFSGFSGEHKFLQCFPSLYSYFTGLTRSTLHVGGAINSAMTDIIIWPLCRPDFKSTSSIDRANKPIHWLTLSGDGYWGFLFAYDRLALERIGNVLWEGLGLGFQYDYSRAQVHAFVPPDFIAYIANITNQTSPFTKQNFRAFYFVDQSIFRCYNVGKVK